MLILIISEQIKLLFFNNLKKIQSKVNTQPYMRKNKLIENIKMN